MPAETLNRLLKSVVLGTWENVSGMTGNFGGVLVGTDEKSKEAALSLALPPRCGFTDVVGPI